MVLKFKDKNISKIPISVKIFLVKALIILIAWQLLYHLYLQKIGIPNYFLTNITTICTSKVVALYYHNTYYLLEPFKSTIFVNGVKAIGIADPCNALEIFVLYISFLVCFPAKNKKRIYFIVSGLPVIFVANIIRCVALTWLNINHKGWVDISHHYIFTTLVYLIVFYLWVLFTKGGNNYESKV